MYYTLNKGCYKKFYKNANVFIVMQVLGNDNTSRESLFPAERGYRLREPEKGNAKTNTQICN